MKDRFRFRAWDKSFRRMIYNIFFFWKENTITVYELHKDASKSYLPNSHIVLEQCTGAKDMNGKLIYEGDIVKFYEYNYEVYFNENTSAMDIWNEKKEVGHSLYYHEKFEVIGNIHENPELLGEQSK